MQKQKGAGQTACIFCKKPIYPEDSKAVELKLALLDSDGHCTGESVTVCICASIRAKGDADYKLENYVWVEVDEGFDLDNSFYKYWDLMQREMEESSEISGGKRSNSNNMVKSHKSRVEGGGKRSNGKKKKNRKKA